LKITTRMHFLVEVDSDGTIQLPRTVLSHLGLGHNDEVVFHLHCGYFSLTKKPGEKYVLPLRGEEFAERTPAVSPSGPAAISYRPGTEFQVFSQNRQSRACFGANHHVSLEIKGRWRQINDR